VTKTGCIQYKPLIL